MSPESLREWLGATSHSARWAAEKAGVSKSTLDRYLKGRAKLNRLDLKALERMVEKMPAPVKSSATAEQPPAAPVQGAAGAILVARRRECDLMEACVDLALDNAVAPQVRVAAIKTALGYALGRPVLLEKQPEKGPEDAEKSKLMKALQRMATGIELAGQLVLPSPVPAAPAEPQEVTVDAADGDAPA